MVSGDRLDTNAKSDPNSTLCAYYLECRGHLQLRQAERESAKGKGQDQSPRGSFCRVLAATRVGFAVPFFYSVVLFSHLYIFNLSLCHYGTSCTSSGVSGALLLSHSPNLIASWRPHVFTSFSRRNCQRQLGSRELGVAPIVFLCLPCNISKFRLFRFQFSWNTAGFQQISHTCCAFLIRRT